MTDALSTAEIKRRSLKGAKWLLVMNGLGMPAAFLVALMLGRVGPETLGVYALAQILVGVITTFVLYGGSPVLSVFLPKLPCAEERGRFIFAYALILLGMMAVTLGLFWSFPRAFEFLLQRKFDMHNYGWFVLLAGMVVLSESLVNTASGLMLIKTAAIARQVVRLILLPLVAALFFFKRGFLAEHGMECILGGFFAGYIVSAVICIIGIVPDQRFKMRLGWALPKGFWGLSFTTMAATVFSFLYSNFDRMAVLSINDLEGLGKYQAIISLTTLIEYIPGIFQTVIVPVFSCLHDPDQSATFKKAFLFVCRNTVFLVTFSSFVMIGFSREILGIFGKEYEGYFYLLCLYCFVSVVRAPAFPGFAILVSKEKNIFRFSQSIVQLTAQMILTVLFMKSYGILAIAGAKMFTAGISTFIGTLYVMYGLNMAPRLPRSYRIAILTTLIMVALRIWFVPPGLLGSILLTFTAFMVFTIGSRLSLNEMVGILQLLRRRTFELSTEAVNKDF